MSLFTLRYFIDLRLSLFFIFFFFHFLSAFSIRDEKQIKSLSLNIKNCGDSQMFNIKLINAGLTFHEFEVDTVCAGTIIDTIHFNTDPTHSNRDHYHRDTFKEFLSKVMYSSHRFFGISMDLQFVESTNKVIIKELVTGVVIAYKLYEGLELQHISHYGIAVQQVIDLILEQTHISDLLTLRAIRYNTEFLPYLVNNTYFHLINKFNEQPFQNLIKQFNKDFVDKFMESFENVELLDKIMDNFVESLLKSIESPRFHDNLLKIFKEIIHTTIQEGFSQNFSIFDWAIEKILDPVLSAIQDVMSKIFKTFIDGLLDMAKPIIDMVFKTLENFLFKILSPLLKQIFKITIESTIELLNVVYEFLQETLPSIFDEIGKLFESILNILFKLPYINSIVYFICVYTISYFNCRSYYLSIVPCIVFIFLRL